MRFWLSVEQTRFRKERHRDDDPQEIPHGPNFVAVVGAVIKVDVKGGTDHAVYFDDVLPVFYWNNSGTKLQPFLE